MDNDQATHGGEVKFVVCMSQACAFMTDIVRSATFYVSLCCMWLYGPSTYSGFPFGAMTSSSVFDDYSFSSKSC